MHHLWARAHLAVLEIRFFGAVVVVVFSSIIVVVYTFTAAKLRFSENKTKKFFLFFVEREDFFSTLYLQVKELRAVYSAKIVQIERNTK